MSRKLKNSCRLKKKLRWLKQNSGRLNSASLKFASHRARTVRICVADFEAAWESNVTLRTAVEGRVETRPWLAELRTACPDRPLQLPLPEVRSGPLLMSGALVVPGSSAMQEA